MKTKIWLFALLLCCALAGCGGGGGGAGAGAIASNPPASPPVSIAAIERFAAGVSFLSPKHMVFVGTNIFVADRTGSGRIAEINSSLQTLVSARTVASPLGIAVSSNGVYYTAIDANGDDGIYLLGNGSSLVALSPSNDFGGLTFYSTTNLFVANGTSVLVYSSADNFSVSTQSIALSAPAALASDISKNLIYASLGNNTVVSINPSTNATTVLTQANPNRWGPFLQPQGIAVSTNGYAYVVSQGDVHGDGGYVSKVNTATGGSEIIVSDTVGSWGSLPIGFCQPTGVAIDANNEYLYVSNGNTCTDAVHHQNHDQILKIKLP
jgi:hypothetical protein